MSIPRRVGLSCAILIWSSMAARDCRSILAASTVRCRLRTSSLPIPRWARPTGSSRRIVRSTILPGRLTKDNWLVFDTAREEQSWFRFKDTVTKGTEVVTRCVSDTINGSYATLECHTAANPPYYLKTRADGLTHYYNQSGRLTKIIDNNGQEQVYYRYSEGLRAFTKLMTAGGQRGVVVNWDSTYNRINLAYQVNQSGVADGPGIRYQYDANNNLTKAYQYEATGNWVGDDPIYYKRYMYENNNASRLTKIAISDNGQEANEKPYRVIMYNSNNEVTKIIGWTLTWERSGPSSRRRTTARTLGSGITKYTTSSGGKNYEKTYTLNTTAGDPTSFVIKLDTGVTRIDVDNGYYDGTNDQNWRLVTKTTGNDGELAYYEFLPVMTKAFADAGFNDWNIQDQITKILYESFTKEYGDDKKVEVYYEYAGMPGVTKSTGDMTKVTGMNGITSTMVYDNNP